jgi:uncharacterized protein
MEIVIKIGELSIEAILNDSYVAKKISEILPFSGNFSTWGDEIYFTIPVKADLDATAQDIVQKGDLGYWPTGKAFCLFYGPTPMSKGNDIVPASAVNIIGRVIGNVDAIKSGISGNQITVQAK